jgi:hypothetical protein
MTHVDKKVSFSNIVLKKTITSDVNYIEYIKLSDNESILRREKYKKKKRDNYEIKYLYDTITKKKIKVTILF